MPCGGGVVYVRARTGHFLGASSFSVLLYKKVTSGSKEIETESQKMVMVAHFRKLP